MAGDGAQLGECLPSVMQRSPGLHLQRHRNPEVMLRACDPLTQWQSRKGQKLKVILSYA